MINILCKSFPGWSVQWHVTWSDWLGFYCLCSLRSSFNLCIAVGRINIAVCSNANTIAFDQGSISLPMLSLFRNLNSARSKWTTWWRINLLWDMWQSLPFSWNSSKTLELRVKVLNVTLWKKTSYPQTKLALLYRPLVDERLSWPAQIKIHNLGEFVTKNNLSRLRVEPDIFQC